MAYSSNALREGYKVEKEHLKSLKNNLYLIAKKKDVDRLVDPYIILNIALDHLKEDRNYYRKLKKVGL
jgi:hypothetical protein